MRPCVRIWRYCAARRLAFERFNRLGASIETTALTETRNSAILRSQITPNSRMRSRRLMAGRCVLSFFSVALRQLHVMHPIPRNGAEFFCPRCAIYFSSNCIIYCTKLMRAACAFFAATNTLAITAYSAFALAAAQKQCSNTEPKRRAANRSRIKKRHRFRWRLQSRHDCCVAVLRCLTA